MSAATTLPSMKTTPDKAGIDNTGADDIELDRLIVVATQAGLPLEPQPYHRIAEALGVDASLVQDRLRIMLHDGRIRRIGCHAKRKVGRDVRGIRDRGASSCSMVGLPRPLKPGGATWSTSCGRRRCCWRTQI